MVPHRDIVFGAIVRWLAARGLEMHTPMKGETWVCKRRAKRPRLWQPLPQLQEDET